MRPKPATIGYGRLAEVHTMNNEYRDPQLAFRDAIASGRLSSNPAAENYAGRYMYMGTRCNGKGDAFKHSLTREYLP